MSKRPSETEEEGGVEKKSRMDENKIISDQMDKSAGEEEEKKGSEENSGMEEDETIPDQSKSPGKEEDERGSEKNSRMDEDETITDQVTKSPVKEEEGGTEKICKMDEDESVPDQIAKSLEEKEEIKSEEKSKMDEDETISDQVSKSVSVTANRSELDRWIGKVALVTGASSGIGATLCRALMQHGMKVVGCSRNVDRIKAISEEDAVKGFPGKLTAIKCDLTKESDILATFDEIRQRFGRLDICINNAGIGHEAPLLSGKTLDFKNMLDVNVLALAICTREAVKLMVEKSVDDGQIIHIGSLGGHFLPPGSPGASFYCGTKFMVRALTEGLRKELKELKSQIRIASVSPGLVQTKFFDNYLKDNTTVKPSDIYQMYPPLQPKDIIESILYILSTPQNVEVHDIIIRPYTS